MVIFVSRNEVAGWLSSQLGKLLITEALSVAPEHGDQFRPPSPPNLISTHSSVVPFSNVLEEQQGTDFCTLA